MGEHRQNPQALIRDMMPRMPGPPTRARQIRFNEELVPKQNVMLLPAERIRTTEGKQEILGRLFQKQEDGTSKPDDQEAWHPVPEGMKVYPFGEKVALQDCDIVFTVASLWANTTIAMAGGQHPTSGQVLLELARVDATTFIAQHEATLGGARLLT